MKARIDAEKLKSKMLDWSAAAKEVGRKQARQGSHGQAQYFAGRAMAFQEIRNLCQAAIRKAAR